jgi:hypothetical protein
MHFNLRPPELVPLLLLLLGGRTEHNIGLLSSWEKISLCLSGLIIHTAFIWICTTTGLVSHLLNAYPRRDRGLASGG